MSAPDREVNAGAVHEVHRIDGLHVETWGDRERPALLLSAGLGGQGGYWRPHLGTLSRTHCVITYDQRGTGESDRAIPQAYGLEHMAHDLRSVLDGLSMDAADVMGHAAGGMAALQLAISSPDRVRSVIVINGWDAPDPHFVRCMEVRKGIMRTQGALAYLTAQPLFLYPAEWIAGHLPELDRQARAHAEGFQSEPTLFARMDALTGTDLRARLGDVRCRVLLVSALDDMLVPASRSVALGDALTCAQVARAVGNVGGHAINITQQDWFEKQVTAFLAAPAHH